MDMLGFLRLRAWDAQREQEKKSCHMKEVFHYEEREKQGEREHEEIHIPDD